MCISAQPTYKKIIKVILKLTVVLEVNKAIFLSDVVLKSNMARFCVYTFDRRFHPKQNYLEIEPTTLLLQVPSYQPIHWGYNFYLFWVWQPPSKFSFIKCKRVCSYRVLMQCHDGSVLKRTRRLWSSVSATCFPEAETANARILSLSFSSDPPPLLHCMKIQLFDDVCSQIQSQDIKYWWIKNVPFIIAISFLWSLLCFCAVKHKQISIRKKYVYEGE